MDTMKDLYIEFLNKDALKLTMLYQSKKNKTKDDHVDYIAQLVNRAFMYGYNAGNCDGLNGIEDPFLTNPDLPLRREVL